MPSAPQKPTRFTVVADPWVDFRSSFDAMLDPLGEAAIARVAPRRGEEILDVGCGCGATTFALAEMVGGEGRVVGVDVSASMLDVARREAQERGVDNVEFIQGDAAVHEFPPDAFDVVYSRLGIMFFNEPGTAFANLHRTLRPNGRFGAVVWRSLEENQWSLEPRKAAAEVLPPAPEPVIGAPGPFSLSDRHRLSRQLKEAGFVDVDIDPHDEPLLIGRGDMETAISMYLALLPSGYLMIDSERHQTDRLKASLRATLNQHQTDDGIWMGSASWIIRAG